MNDYRLYIFEDGYSCYVRGFSKQELAVVIKKHGKLVRVEKL